MFEIAKADPALLDRIERSELFDFYRIVDVDTYTVYELRGGRLIPQPERCYEVWKRGAACQNCVSRLAVSENRQAVKMEALDDSVFLIVSLPFEAVGRHMAMELIMDVTGSLLFGDGIEKDNTEFSDLIRKMNDLAIRDPYIGLYNKRYAEQELCKAVLEWQEATPFSIAILDIDRFKEINDTYGHPTGDEALLSLAKLLSAHAARGNGWASRIGGDEFLLSFWGVSLQDVQTRLEALRKSVERLEFKTDGGCFHISVSIGAAEYRPEIGGWRALYSLADQTMYADKRRRAAKKTALSADAVPAQGGEAPPSVYETHKKLLVVDDVELNREILKELFQERYDVLEAENGRQALALLAQYKDETAAVLLDVVMPVMNGLETLREIQKRQWTDLFPVIMITAENGEELALQSYDLGAADIIVKPFSARIVLRRVSNNVDLTFHRRHLEELVHEQTEAIEQANRLMKRQTEQLRDNNDFIVDTLNTVVEFRDGESGAHVKHMRRITAVLMKALSDQYPAYRMTPEQIETIASAAAMHDIGKIAIPDAVLLKPGPLTREEFEIMKTHTTRGCELLENMHYDRSEAYYSYCYEICRHHHERWDGNGYPDGLKGNRIPIWAQVASIADAYEALISKRVYKPAYPHEQAVKMISEGDCGVFNPDLIRCFLQIADVLRDKTGSGEA